MSEFTPEQVDRAAEALWLSQDGRRVACCSPRKPWAGLAEVTKKICREDARAVLSAAGVPEKVTPVVDEAALAEVRREAAEKAWEEGYGSGCKDSMGPLPFSKISENPYRKDATA